MLPVLALGQNPIGTFAAPAGDHGVWIPQNAGDERLVELDDADATSRNPFAIETNPLQRTPRVAGSSVAAQSFRKLTLSEVPFQPWSRALFATGSKTSLSPHTRCKPSGGPRQFATPYGVEFLEQPEPQRIFIVDIGGPTP
jgi:hypothetical protein